MKALVLGLVLLCASPVQDGETILMFGVRPFVPTILEAAVYTMMERCTGLEGDFDGVTWKTARSMVRTPDGALLLGAWQKDVRIITLRRDYRWDAGLISHEILHDLYRGETPRDVQARCQLR
jgi:hypothetical protein